MRKASVMSLRWSHIPVGLALLIISVPIVTTLLIGALAGGGETWTHISATFFWTYLTNTILIMVFMTVFMSLAAIPAAWFVTMHRFAGRGVFSWLLILPLAAPGYVLAYSYADFTSVAGPLQSALREATGLSAREYWFPNIRSLVGCAYILSMALFPYVYLAARAGFQTQSMDGLQAAQTLGAGPLKRFVRIALPSARPAIVAGLALALMEAGADFGTADFLGVRTLTVGVFRAWASFGDPAAGARLAISLVALTFVLLWLERRQRGNAGYQSSPRRASTLQRTALTGWAAVLVPLYCLTVFLLSFGIPIAYLVHRALDAGEQTVPIWDAAFNSIRLAGIGAAATFAIAFTIALAAHRNMKVGKLGVAVSAWGYAIPGAVLALGAVYSLLRLGVPLSGLFALFLLTLVYVSRFAAAGTEQMQAALHRAPISYTHAAQSLGAGPVRRMLDIDLPLIAPGAAVAALILFIEILKELPATLMLRPFNWDTLAVRAYAYASDERLAAAAAPSLAITIAGLVPVLILSWRLNRIASGPRS